MYFIARALRDLGGAPQSLWQDEIRGRHGSSICLHKLQGIHTACLLHKSCGCMLHTALQEPLHVLETDMSPAKILPG